MKLVAWNKCERDIHPILDKCLMVGSCNCLQEDCEFVLSVGGIERK